MAKNNGGEVEQLKSGLYHFTVPDDCQILLIDSGSRGQTLNQYMSRSIIYFSGGVVINTKQSKKR